MVDKIAVRCVVPNRDNSRVFKDECVFCFQTPEHDGGLYVCLNTHVGYCPVHLKKMVDMHRATGKEFGTGGYLHCQRTRRKMQKKGEEPEQKITKLAIGVEGGLQETQYEFDDKYQLAIFPGPTMYELTDDRLDANVRSCCDAIIACESANRLRELESLATAWDGSFVQPTKHVDLPQLTPARKIPPKGWRCEVEGCDKTDNLWLNLTDGKILCGRKFFDGSGGNNHAIDHYQKVRYPLAVKLGTITAHGADVFSYDEDEMVSDPKLEQHLSHFGINMAAMEKTDKTMLELELDLNQKYEYSRIQETGHELTPVYGSGFTGLVNLGSSCYMNTALQTLAMIPDVHRIYTGDAADRIFFSSVSTKGPSDHGDSFQVQFAKLFDGLLSGRFSTEPAPKVDENVVLPDSSVRPLIFRTLIGRGHAEFSSRRQQDVEEYLRWMCEKLEQQNDIGAGTIVDAFRFETLEHLHCPATGRGRNERRPEIILSLPVPMEKAVNLDEVRQYEQKRKLENAANRTAEDAVFAKVPLRACIEMFAAPGIIENVRSPFDDKVITAIRKTQYLTTFPDYLLVQIRRFTVADDWTPKKLEVEILLDDMLDIEDLLVPKEFTEEEPMDVTPSVNKESPEELAAISQLTDAGFPINACRKAWRHGGGKVDVAFDWLLAHVGDGDFDQPELVPAAVTVGDVDTINNITSMGFTRDQARKALRLSNGNFEMAVGWLLDNPGDPGEPEPAQAVASAAATGAASANRKYRNGPGKYRLIGFISHMGSSAHSGHYVCHLLKNVDGHGERWVIYNDEKVALSQEPPKGFGYIYLYERVK